MSAEVWWLAVAVAGLVFHGVRSEIMDALELTLLHRELRTTSPNSAVDRAAPEPDALPCVRCLTDCRDPSTEDGLLDTACQIEDMRWTCSRECWERVAAMWDEPEPGGITVYVEPDSVERVERRLSAVILTYATPVDGLVPMRLTPMEGEASECIEGSVYLSDTGNVVIDFYRDPREGDRPAILFLLPAPTDTGGPE